jgi:hypothetical protein
VSDLPIDLEEPLATQLARAVDVEGKIPRALDALGQLAGRDVLAVDAGGLRVGQLEGLGARVRVSGSIAEAAGVPEESVDAVVGWWSSFRGVDPAEIAGADRVLRGGGRVLVVHDYGRDDVSALLGERPEYTTWGRRDGPFLSNGFRIRVLHCWWTFGSTDEAADFLAQAFGDAGRAVAERLRRPRLSYNVAVYHRAKLGHVA